jgi:hypothetical protein
VAGAGRVNKSASLVSGDAARDGFAGGKDVVTAEIVREVGRWFGGGCVQNGGVGDRENKVGCGTVGGFCGLVVASCLVEVTFVHGNGLWWILADE